MVSSVSVRDVPATVDSSATNTADFECTQAAMRGMLNRHPAVGFVLGLVRDDLTTFVTHGFADVAKSWPVSEKTVFRVGSITKTFTAVAIMQLVEEGRLDLDASATDCLRSFRLTRRERGFTGPTLRQLLTHTSGIPDARHLGDLLHFSWGPWDGRPPTFSVPIGETLPSLEDYYRDGLEVVVQPGTAFAYSNPAFATLGQIVADVTGTSLERYMLERIFQPLGMTDTDLVRTDAIASKLAKGYVFGRTGPGAVPDRDWIDKGAGGVYSTARDLSKYADALLHGGANEHGRVLKRESLEAMFAVSYEAEPGLPALGLSFFRSEMNRLCILSHDGIVPGFNSHLSVVPERGIGVIALTNGSSGAMRWMPGELDQWLHELIGVPQSDPPVDIPHHPETWPELCGRYVLPPRIGDMRGRLAMGPGLEVLIRGGRPVARLWWPVPVVSRSLPLIPDDEDDPFAFRVDLSAIGVGRIRARFRRSPNGTRVIHTDLGGQPVSFVEADPRTWSRARSLAIAATATALAVAGARRAGRRRMAS